MICFSLILTQHNTLFLYTKNNTVPVILNVLVGIFRLIKFIVNKMVLASMFISVGKRGNNAKEQLFPDILEPVRELFGEGLPIAVHWPGPRHQQYSSASQVSTSLKQLNTKQHIVYFKTQLLTYTLTF